MMTELVAPAQHIRESLRFFLRREFVELQQATRADRELADMLEPLGRDLEDLIARCSDCHTPAECVDLVERYDQWCEEFELLESAEFETEILQTWVALP